MIDSIGVMLVEDSPEYRDVIRLALAEETGIELTSQFGTAEIAIRTLQDPASRIAPDLILLDVRLPGMDGITAIRGFLDCSPNSKIIVLTQSNQERDVLRAIAAGASGYLLKSATLSDLTTGIRTVINGGATLDPGVARFVLQTLQKKLPDDQREGLLSKRELEILALLAEGLVKKEIAKRLDIGYTTVDTHVSRIYLKLRVSNAPSAVNQAHRLNLFTPDR